MCLKIWSQALKKSTVQSAVATANDTTKVNATQVASPNAQGNALVAADVNKKTRRRAVNIFRFATF